MPKSQNNFCPGLHSKGVGIQGYANQLVLAQGQFPWDFDILAVGLLEEAVYELAVGLLEEAVDKLAVGLLEEAVDKLAEEDVGRGLKPHWEAKLLLENRIVHFRRVRG